MIHHTKDQEQPTSFFALLSVVSCAVGVLLLVLVGVTMASFWGARQVVRIPIAKRGGKTQLQRIYVECRGDGLIVHPAQVIVSPLQLEDPSRWMDGPFGECLRSLVGSGRGGTVFFLVRKDGIVVYRKALEYAVTAGGGTAEAVGRGEAVFAIGQQLVVLPGKIKVLEDAAMRGNSGRAEP